MSDPSPHGRPRVAREVGSVRACDAGDRPSTPGRGCLIRRCRRGDRARSVRAGVPRPLRERRDGRGEPDQRRPRAGEGRVHARRHHVRGVRHAACARLHRDPVRAEPRQREDRRCPAWHLLHLRPDAPGDRRPGAHARPAEHDGDRPVRQRRDARGPHAAVDFDGPVYMRELLGRETRDVDRGAATRSEIGEGQLLREGTDVGIVASGDDGPPVAGRGRRSWPSTAYRRPC